MKILYDHQLFCYRFGGASKYFAMMIHSLPEGVEWATTTLLSCNEYVRAKRMFRTSPVYFRGLPRILELLNRPYTNAVVRRGDFDVLHQTNFGTFFKGSLGRKPLVATFHDVNMSTRSPNPSVVRLQRQSLQRADAIIAVSENTKRDMLELFDVDERKVHVVYHGIELPPDTMAVGERITQSPYILYVGLRAAYKNFRGFVQAFALLRERHPELKLVCTSTPFTPEERRLLANLRLSDSVVHVSASEAQMLSLYRNALFFVYPSFYEGFGMPILEAWSCGCPVLLSRASCFPEIAGEAGLYFNPNEIDDILAAMERAADDESLRKALAAKGSERVKMFSWERCAREHALIYASLV